MIPTSQNASEREGRKGLGVAPVDATLYPFAPHFFALPSGPRMHYVDEGQGPVVVMVHGNPTWSFYFRELIKLLSATHRVIAPDHVGCGYSDKPCEQAYAYTLEQRVADLEALLEHLEVRSKVTLVLHDWGGMIGMAWATRHPERITRLVLLNTAAFGLPKTKRFPLALRLVRNTGLGAMLVERFNAFSRGALMLAAMRPLAREVAQGLTAPYEAPENRLATLRFVQDIPLKPEDPGYELVQKVREGLPGFAHLPVFVGWGHKDFVFDHHFLAVWKEIFPQAHYREFPDAGHYILEDAREEILGEIAEFVQGAKGAQGEGALAGDAP